MATRAPIRTLFAGVDEGLTEFLDGIACLDERVRRQAIPAEATAAGRYIEIQEV
jgi:hypothetical protein